MMAKCNCGSQLRQQVTGGDETGGFSEGFFVFGVKGERNIGEMDVQYVFVRARAVGTFLSMTGQVSCL